MNEVLLQISINAIPVLLAITVHEFFHAWTAEKLGDPTAKIMGRVSLNPLQHIDLFGTVLLPIMLLLTNSPFMIAWAKPVPINPLNFRRPYRDMAISSLAGPLSNLVMSVLFLLLYKFALTGGFAATGFHELFVRMSRAGFFLNFALFAFNLLPIPPLDGSKVLMSLLPLNLRLAFEKVEPYGFMILLLLIVLGVFNVYMNMVFKLFLMTVGGLLA